MKDREEVGGGLWTFAAEVYAAPGMEAASLRLQDEGGQCVGVLFWGLWRALSERPVDTGILADAVHLARPWEDSVAAPLRAARRALRSPAPGVEDTARLALRSRVAAASLESERALLEALERLPLGEGVIGAEPLEVVGALAARWGGAPAFEDLRILADAACEWARRESKDRPRDGGTGPQQALPLNAEVLQIPNGRGRGRQPMHGDDEFGDEPVAETAEEFAAEGETAIRRKLGELRQAHQDLDAAVAALEGGARPDQLQIARLKKKKLVLRDQIAKLDNRLTPDIIA